MPKTSGPDRDHCDPASDFNLRIPGKCNHSLVWRIPEKKCIPDTNYLENAIPDDAAGIRWLNDNVNGQPVVLEASGDSYKDYDNRVSAMTGLPTVLGWYVHEWLWRNNLEEENQRKEEVQTIYTSSNVEQIKSLIEKYKISYLFIGSCEAEKYGEINSELLTSLGKVVFRQGETMIIEVSDGGRAD